ncbi:hypothetical protein GCL60_16590 [Silvanigrella paludirubra]|uniref:Phage protein Gp138 N-terminal domain-containing protein n=1 Tax=Silvanigrella paludirubra TaxID=2499159 RepID=A0A6N6VP94_9BACT|nr:Gp138 family membrane-puncturing spike protein [Silvanigrella paludirubra]KAB8035847.1 hypothetical protein GCL60_16590 [Silvanigrella paludirubra]
MSTPSFYQIIYDAIDSNIKKIHTAMPAIVKSYDEKLQKISVQPCFMDKEIDVITGLEIPRPLPVIQSVPVLFPRTKLSYIHFPIDIGDYVLLIFLERSIDNYTQTGGLVESDSNYKHELSDCVALAGFYPFSQPMLGVNKKALQIVNSLSEIKLTDDGKIYLSNRGAVSTEAKLPDEPLVLGNILVEFANKLIESIDKIADALQKNIGVGNLGAPVTASPSLITELKKIQIDLKENKIIYLDNNETNINSNHFFGEK